MSKTHDITNQVPPLVNYNLFTQDQCLREALKNRSLGWSNESLTELGQVLGSEDSIRAGFLANEYRPILRTHNRFGERIDEVEFHPSWHQVLGTTISFGVHSSPWSDPREGAHVTRAAAAFLCYQNEQGNMCPTTMTYGATPVLRQQPDVILSWEPKILSRKYDSRFRPVSEKTGAMIGMAMTEKQGGSDVRTNTTIATAIGAKGPGKEYRITGHKWFCSAPMSDAFLVLAQTDKGPSCFFVPRWTPDGNRNAFYIQRLKDKLGDRSNASSEIEFENTWSRLIGEEGRGVATIIEMANYTRLDCAIAGAALIRQALTQALHHAQYRSAFGKKLIEQPLMQNVLADLCLESEAATLSFLRLAQSYDRKSASEQEKNFGRVATAVMKFWLTKRSIVTTSEALEVHGGNGFVEESVMPRLFRQAPVNSLWEGSGNVMCLDVLRALNKDPKAVDAFLSEVQKGTDKNPHLKRYVSDLTDRLKKNGSDEHQARVLVEQMAVALQGSLLVSEGDPQVAEAFCRGRLADRCSYGFGTLPKDLNFKHILERSKVPAVSI